MLLYISSQTLSAAFWLWVILGQKQSTIQIFSLFLLLVAAVMLNLNGTSRSLNSSKMDYNFGLFCCAMASSLSGLSGALVQRALVGSSAQNPLVYTAELAIYGIAFLLVSALFSTRERELILGGNLFHDWNPLTLIPVTTNVRINSIVFICIRLHVCIYNASFSEKTLLRLYLRH